MTSEAGTPRRNGRILAALGWALCAALLVIAATQGRAQERAAGAQADPRVGLGAGLRDAGQAARHMELVVALPKPEGFFDPEAPAGHPVPPERDEPEEPERPATPEGEAAAAAAERPAGEATPEQPAGAETPEQPERPSRPSFSNTDLAFSGEHLFVGNYHGFNVYNLEDPKQLRQLGSVVCPGGQGDVSVYGSLLFMSVQETRGRLDCGTGGVEETVSTERFRGVRIFDISDVRSPRQVAAVQTCRGSHTHTLVLNPKDKANVYVYNSGTSRVRPGEELEGCSDKEPDEDPNTALFSIDVIQVPLAAPEKARIVSRPRIFADPSTGNIAGLWAGGDHGPGTQETRRTNQCHDITVFPEVGLAAGACAGNGILIDISDPMNPVRLDQVTDRNFAYWHSATFNNQGTKVIFTDEWGGGSRPRCRDTDLPTWGADALFDIVDRKLQFRGYYKLPAPQSDQENCVAHNGSLIPVPGRDIMVQAWYQGGLSVFDFTDSANPFEIAFFDRGPLDAEDLILGGYWSTYWHNGYVYGAEIARGIDVFRLTPSEHLSQNEIAAASLVRYEEFNAQLQPKVTWPARPVVARAYLDQLDRTNGIMVARARAVRSALDRADGQPAGQDAAALKKELEELATAVEGDAVAAVARDAGRLKSLAETLKGIAATLG